MSLDDKIREASRLDALAEAGSRYDAAIRAVWADVDPALGQRQSRALASRA
jgi:hypothetical protein